MDFNNGNRMAQPRPVKKDADASPRPASTPRAKFSKGRLIVPVVIAVAAIAIIGLGIFWWLSPKGEEGLVNKSQYQAIFLTNGQVYFAKLNSINDDYLKISDIYYLQVQQSVQPTDDKKAETPDASQSQLVKLGSELHGPEDSMQINRQQVLFWENIKADGKVAKAISEFKKK